MLYCITCLVCSAITTTTHGQDTAKTESIKILFVGDIMLDGGPGHMIASGLDPFEHCAPMFNAADLCIGNLECVPGRGGEQQLKPYTFRAASDSPRYLKKYFHGLSLANNHTLDFGPDGVTEAMRVLDKEKIRHFGAGKNIKEARKPLILECKGRKIALFGYNEFFSEDYVATDTRAGNVALDADMVVADIRMAKDELGCDIVIPFLHWGEEMMPQPRADQRQMAKKWIDAGATAVIGTHPHVTQTVEYHHGKPIIYSLGNFVFDYFPGDPPVSVGWVAVLEISKDQTVDLNLSSVDLDPAGAPKPSPEE